MTLKETLKTTLGVLCAILVLVVIWVFYVGCQVNSDGTISFTDFCGHVYTFDPQSAQMKVEHIKFWDEDTAKSGDTGEGAVNVDPSGLKSTPTQKGTGGTQSTVGGGHGHSGP